MTECYFTQKKDSTSSTICANCGLEKMLHTIGEGLKVTKIEIFTSPIKQTEMTQRTIIKDFLTQKGLLTNDNSVFVISGDFGTVTLNGLLEEFSNQQLSAERERLEALIKNEPVSFFLVNIMRNLPNEKWPDLINALNERCSLPTAERERAGKLVEALKMCLYGLCDKKEEYQIYMKAKQTLNDYEKEITGNQDHTNPSS